MPENMRDDADGLVHGDASLCAMGWRSITRAWLVRGRGRELIQPYGPWHPVLGLPPFVVLNVADVIRVRRRPPVSLAELARGC